MSNIYINNMVRSTLTTASSKSQSYTDNSICDKETVERFNQAMYENHNKIEVGRGRETPNNPNCYFNPWSIISGAIAGSSGGLKGIFAGTIGGFVGSLQCDGKGPKGLFGGPGSGSESSDDTCIK